MSPATSRKNANALPTVRWPVAVRPASGAAITPVEAYRAERYFNRQTGFSVPALVAAADESRVFELFLALLEPLGSVVDVYLESTHNRDASSARVLRREAVDAPVFASILCDAEDWLLNDGCTSVTVACTRSPIEVQLDEHKHIVIYAWERKPFARIMQSFGLRRLDSMLALFDVPHVHFSTPAHAECFENLADSLGTSEYHRVVTG